MKSTSLLLLTVALALTGCGSQIPRDDVVQRDGQPDYHRVADEDADIAKAIQTARKSVDTFISALKTPSAQQTGFSVKKPFKDGKKVEHIWLSDTSFDGTEFRGRVDNEPVDVKNVKMGEIATANKDEISDWFYIDKGKLVGGYTLRVLYARMSPEEKKDFQAQLPFKID